MQVEAHRTERQGTQVGQVVPHGVEGRRQTGVIPGSDLNAARIGSVLFNVLCLGTVIVLVGGAGYAGSVVLHNVVIPYKNEIATAIALFALTYFVISEREIIIDMLASTETAAWLGVRDYGYHDARRRFLALQQLRRH